MELCVNVVDDDDNDQESMRTRMGKAKNSSFFVRRTVSRGRQGQEA